MQKHAELLEGTCGWHEWNAGMEKIIDSTPPSMTRDLTPLLFMSGDFVENTVSASQMLL